MMVLTNTHAGVDLELGRTLKAISKTFNSVLLFPLIKVRSAISRKYPSGTMRFPFYSAIRVQMAAVTNAPAMENEQEIRENCSRCPHPAHGAQCLKPMGWERIGTGRRPKMCECTHVENAR